MVLASLLAWLAIPCAHAVPEAVHRKQFALWGQIKKPLPGPDVPYGTYAAGCLAGARKLPLDGPGFSVMRPSRQRYYGHSSLIEYIQGLGKTLKKEGLPLLLVGDLGRPRGGPMLTGHSSHQVGLDVDLWYRMSKKRPTTKQRENWSAENFVKNESELTSSWNDSYRKLLVAAAQSPAVNRIFVHPVIKRDLCEKFAGAPWLYKYRAWWAHHDHLHVRLQCPPGLESCHPQEPLEPTNDQCGKELAWWFSAEAKEEGAKKGAAFASRVFPELPPECGRMVSDLRGKKK